MTTFITDCIKVTYLSSSSRKESEDSEERESDKEETIVGLRGQANKTHLTDDPDKNSKNVTLKDTGGAGKMS